MENGTLSPTYYSRTRAIRWSNRFGGGLGSSSRPCLVKTIRRTLIWHPEQIKVWCSKPRTATVFSGTTFVRISSASHAVQCTARTPPAKRPPIVASIEHFHRHPEVTRYGDGIVFDLVRRGLDNQAPTPVPITCEVVLPYCSEGQEQLHPHPAPLRHACCVAPSAWAAAGRQPLMMATFAWQAASRATAFA